MYWNHVESQIQNEVVILTFSTPTDTKLQSNCVDKYCENPQSIIINSTQDQILVKYVRLNYKQM